MRKRTKYSGIGLAVFAVVLITMLMPGLPWSARNRYNLNRAARKVKLKFSAWHGTAPKQAALSGHLIGRTARVEVLNTTSYWASLTNEEGRFCIPDVLWYPNAEYELLVIADAYNVRRVKITAPDTLPDDATIDAGEFRFDDCEELGDAPAFGLNSVSYEEYDKENQAYYRELFDRLTAGKGSHDERLLAVNDYVAGRRIYNGGRQSFTSPRQILEEGTEFCGNLCLAMASIVEAGGYKSRRLDLRDPVTRESTHVLIEIYYNNRWHLYDPTFGVIFRNHFGEVASYKDVRLDGSLISDDVFQRLNRRTTSWVKEFLPRVYSSGFHHFYYFRRRPDLCPSL